MIKELLKIDRTYRRFDNSFEIKSELLHEIIDGVRFCHSARNQQGLMFKSIVDKELCNKIFPMLKWAGYLPQWQGPSENERPTGYIIIAINSERSNVQDKWVFTDIGIASEAISLQLAEKSLGSCIIAAFDKPKLSELLNVQPNIDIQLVLAIGKPVENVEIIEINAIQNIKYYRNGDIHIVPKRKINDILF